MSNPSTRAKFRVSHVEPHFSTGANGERTHVSTTISLHAVYTGSDENKQFWKLTPSGQIGLSVVSPEVAERFTPGAEFYVDFTPAT